jgi:tripartite-type tricarboxylate transporter receptor subunit TctC
MKYPLTTMKKWSLTTASLAISATLTFAPIASASSSKTKTCTSGAGTKVVGASACSGLAYYQGKTVTFISDGAPSGSYDYIARDLSPYLSTYLRASVNPLDITAGGTIAGQDTLAKDPPNGLTIGEGNPTGDILEAATNTPGINFNLERETFIGAIPQGAQILISNPSETPITTFSQLITTPGLSLIGTCQGQPDLFAHMLDAIWGAHIVYTCGFSSGAQVTQGFSEDDGPLAVNALPNFGPLVKGGVGHVLMVSQKSPKGLTYQSYVNDALTPAQAAKQVPPKTSVEKKDLAVAETTIEASNIVMIMPARTSALDRQTIVAAVTWAMKQPGLQVQLLNSGVPDRLIPGTSAKKTYLDVEKNVAVLGRILNSSS